MINACVYRCQLLLKYQGSYIFYYTLPSQFIVVNFLHSILPPPLPPHHYPGTPPVIRRTQQFSSDSSPGPLSPNVHFFRSELPPPLPPRGISHYPGTPPITRRTHPFCSDSFPGRRPPSHSLVDHYHYNTPPIIQRTRPFSSESSLPFRPRLDTPKKPPPIPPRSALPSSSDAHKWFYHTLSHESAEAILIKYHRVDLIIVLQKIIVSVLLD